ncbi:MAG TPA: hypothetical protein VIY47_04810 [Ignavibacteriaceae bacterium]
MIIKVKYFGNNFGLFESEAISLFGSQGWELQTQELENLEFSHDRIVSISNFSQEFSQYLVEFRKNHDTLMEYILGR